MVNVNKIHPYAFILLFCLAVWALVMWSCAFAPFGAGVMAYMDNLACYAPQVGALGRILDGSETLNFSFLSGGVPRHSFLPTALDFLMPSTWMAWLASSHDIQSAISWTVFFQTVLAAWACFFYLSHTFAKNKTSILVLLSLAYAFSYVYYKMSVMVSLYNPAIVFPLFLYGLDMLLKREKWLLYTVVLVFVSVGCTYHAWMFGLFASMYTLCYVGLGRRGRNAKNLLTLLIATALGMGAGAFSWLPSLIVVGESARAGGIYLFRLSVVPDSISLWLLPPLVMGMLLVVVRRGITMPYNRYLWSTLLLVACLCWRGYDQIWHQSVPIGFPGRYAYMASMMACCYAASLPLRKVGMGKGIRCGFPLLLAVFAIWAAIGIACSFLPQLPNGPHVFGCAMTGAVLVVALFFVNRRRSEFHFVATASLMFAAIVVASVFLHRVTQTEKNTGGSRLEYVRSESVAKYLAEAHLCNPLEGRVSGKESLFSLNSAEFCRISTITNYFHSLPSHNQDMFALLGYGRSHTVITDDGGTIFSDSFLGLQYFAFDRPAYDGLLEKLPSPGEGLHLYRNPYHWGIGTLCRKPGQATKIPATPAEYQNYFFNLLGGDGKLLSECRAEIDKDNAGNWSFSVTRDDLSKTWLYSSFEGLYPAQIQQLLADHEPVPAPCPRGGYQKENHLYPIPPSGARHSLTYRMAGDKADAQWVRDAYVLDGEKVAKFAENQRGMVRIASMRGQRLEVEISPKNGEDYLVLPFHYIKGYTAESDGEKMEVEDFAGFLGISLPNGKPRHLSVEYERPSTAEGWIISLVSLMLLFAWWHWRNCPIWSSLVLNRLCFAGLVVMWGGIIVALPIASIVCRMALLLM